MQSNNYESPGGSEDTSYMGMAQQVRETYLKSGPLAAWAQLSAIDRAIPSNQPAETMRYQHLLGELQREGILPKISEAVREQLAQGKQPAAECPAPQRTVAPAPTRETGTPVPAHEHAQVVPPHLVSQQHENTNNVANAAGAPTADKQIIQSYIDVSLRAQTGQLDQKGREWLDSTWKYLQGKESSQELQQSRTYIESQIRQHGQTAKSTEQHDGTMRPPYAIESGVSSYQDIRDQIMDGLKLAGVTNPTDAQGLAIYNVGYRESRWRAHPPHEGSSKGPMQMEIGTFNANYVPGHSDIRSITDSVAAATRYIAGKYGDGRPGSGLDYIGNRHSAY